MTERVVVVGESKGLLPFHKILFLFLCFMDNTIAILTARAIMKVGSDYFSMYSWYYQKKKIHGLKGANFYDALEVAVIRKMLID